MTLEALGVIGVLVLAATSIGGWAFTLRKNNKAEGAFEQRVKDLHDTVSKIPCVADPQYFQRIGELNANMRNLTDRLKELEETVFRRDRRAT